MSYVEILKKNLTLLYDRNTFVRLLDMRIVEIKEGEAILTMPVDPTKHTNLYDSLHGGALASLADTVMGVACATLGNRVVTIDMNINFIKSAQKQDVVYAEAKVIHCGRKTMVVEAEMQDSGGQLLGKARGTFMIIGKFEVEAV